MIKWLLIVGIAAWILGALPVESPIPAVPQLVRSLTGQAAGVESVPGAAEAYATNTAATGPRLTLGFDLAFGPRRQDLIDQAQAEAIQMQNAGMQSAWIEQGKTEAEKAIEMRQMAPRYAEAFILRWEAEQGSLAELARAKSLQAVGEAEAAVERAELFNGLLSGVFTCVVLALAIADLYFFGFVVKKLVFSFLIMWHEVFTKEVGTSIVMQTLARARDGQAPVHQHAPGLLSVWPTVAGEVQQALPDDQLVELARIAADESVLQSRAPRINIAHVIGGMITALRSRKAESVDAPRERSR